MRCSDYDYDLKKRMNRNLLSINYSLKTMNTMKDLEMIQYNDLYYRIQELPKELQKKIYIFAIKSLNRRSILESNLIPIHIRYNQHLMKYRKKVCIDNIHFLHLDCNTLPENKKYIIGCQCEYCKCYPQIKKEKLKKKIWNTSLFLKSIGSCDNCFGNGVILPNTYDDTGINYTSYVTGYNYTKEEDNIVISFLG